MRVPRDDDGFTLVELMVVVLIIGILVAIAIPIFNSASENARQKTCQGNMRTIEGAVEQYLATDPGNDRAACNGAGWVAELVGEGRFLKVEPVCPTAAGHYTYDAASLQAACGNPAGSGGPHPHF